MTDLDALLANLGAEWHHCRDCPAHIFNTDCGGDRNPLCQCECSTEGKLRWGAAAAIRELRKELENRLPMSGAYAPEATCKHGVHPYGCDKGCDPHTLSAELEAAHRANIAGLKELEAELEAAKRALRSIAANSCCDKCQEAALVARAALARG